jgi:hypothetical protein
MIFMATQVQSGMITLILMKLDTGPIIRLMIFFGIITHTIITHTPNVLIRRPVGLIGMHRFLKLAFVDIAITHLPLPTMIAIINIHRLILITILGLRPRHPYIPLPIRRMTGMIILTRKRHAMLITMLRLINILAI